MTTEHLINGLTDHNLTKESKTMEAALDIIQYDFCNGANANRLVYDNCLQSTPVTMNAPIYCDGNMGCVSPFFCVTVVSIAVAIN